MTDKISIKIENLEVQLPASHIIVEKEEYLNMKKKASAGQYMTLNDVLEMVSVSRPWLFSIELIFAQKLILKRIRMVL